MKTKTIRFLTGEFQNLMHTPSGSCDLTYHGAEVSLLHREGKFGEDWNLLATI